MAKNAKKKTENRLPILPLLLLLTALLGGIFLLRGKTQTQSAQGQTAFPVSAEPSAAAESRAGEEAPGESAALLRLSELMAKNRTAYRAPDGSFPDWIELYNADERPVELEGWRLSDKEEGGWTLPARTLQPGEYLLLLADGSGRVEEGLLCADFSLSPGETVTLFSPGGAAVDRMSCSAEKANRAVARGENGESFETADATPGLPNTRESAEAYALSLRPAGPLCLSEAVVSDCGSAAQNGESCDWVEVKNISDEPVLLSDYCLSDDEEELLLYRLPAQTLEPGQYFLVFCSGGDGPAGDERHAPFALDGAEEDLFLTAADGRLVDYVCLHDVPAGGSLARPGDDLGWARYLTPSPEADNGPAPVFLDKTRLAAGEPLHAVNGAGYTLRVELGGTERPLEDAVPDETLYESWITLRAYDGEALIAEDRAYFSKLPVVYLDTLGAAPIRTKTDYVPGRLSIQGGRDETGCEYAGSVRVRGRGNTSWEWWPKKPYRLKLGSKADLFGMGENKNWCLLPNYLDESFLRNATGQQLSKELGLPSMDSVWTDVVLNGEYIGAYLLCETIRVGESRVDVFDWEEEAERVADAIWEKETALGASLDRTALEKAMKKDLDWITRGVFPYRGLRFTISDYAELPQELSGGYLFELSMDTGAPSMLVTKGELLVTLKSPRALWSNQTMMDYVRSLWQSFDAAIRSEDGYASAPEGERHYTELADLDSMVAFWLAEEIMGNNDADWKSRFAYKDFGEKLRFGPVWDFDWGCGSSKTGASGVGWVLAQNGKKQAFYREFLDDPLFIVRATEQYWQLRPTLERLTAEDGILVSEIAYLREAGLADEARWDRRETWPDEARGFEKDAEIFLAYLRERVEWLDEQFASDRGLLESVHTPLSSCPYVIADELLSVTLPDAAPDTRSAHAPADGVVPAGRDVSVTVALSGTDRAELLVYVNGLRAQSVTAEEGSARFTVASELLNAPDGRKNVVSLIVKSAAGKTLGRSFVTLLVEG